MRHSILLQRKDVFLFFIGYKNTAPERTFIESVEKLQIGLNIQRP